MVKYAAPCEMTANASMSIFMFLTSSEQAVCEKGGKRPIIFSDIPLLDFEN